MSYYFKVGSKKWIAHKIKEDDYTFADMVQYEQLMDHYIMQGIAQGDDRGFPIVTDKDVIPQTEIYELSDGRVGRRRSTTPDLQCPFLRSGAAKEAVEGMRDLNMYIAIIHARNMPPGMMAHDWNNIAETTWQFSARYLAAEGVPRGSDMERYVLLYNFHGTYLYKRKIRGKLKVVAKPVSHALHFKLTNNRFHMTAQLLWLLICYSCSIVMAAHLL